MTAYLAVLVLVHKYVLANLLRVAHATLRRLFVQENQHQRKTHVHLLLLVTLSGGLQTVCNYCHLPS